MQKWCLVVAALIAAGAVAAPRPAFYVKKADWLETLIASREALARSAAGEKAPVPLPDLGRSDFTVMAWVRTIRGGTIFAKAPLKGKWIEQGKSLFIGRGKACFDIGWVGVIQSRQPVADGKWHHVALVGGRWGQRIYVDGRLGADGRLEAEPDPKACVAKIGYTSVDFPDRRSGFLGAIDEVRIYGRALSAEEVRAHLEKPAGPEASGLLGYWPFDGDGTDASGSQNHATKLTGCDFTEGRKGKALRLNGKGCVLLPGAGRPDPRGALWELLKRDFPDASARQEMDWEREDGIWSAWRPGDWAGLARAYARASHRRPKVAERAAELAKAVKDRPGLTEIRGLYLRSRRYGLILAELRRFRVEPLQRAIAQLTRTHAAGYPKGPEHLARLNELVRHASRWRTGASGDDSMAEWAGELAKLRHDALIADNPLMRFDKLLFVKRYTYHSSHFYTDFIDGVGNYGGNLCVLDLKTGEASDLIPEMAGGIFGRFDLHFSARKVVFDWKKARREGFRIFEIDIDPQTGRRLGKVRQLTFPPDDEEERILKYDNSFLGGTGRMYYHQTDDLHPCYLPGGGICFTSTRCEYGTLCDAPDILSTAVLYRMDLPAGQAGGDGGNLQKLTNSPVSEFSPSMMADGRILYARWEYVDKGQLGIKCLWAMRPNGTASVEVYGNDIQYPPTLIHGRQVPGDGDMFVVLGTPHYPQSGIGTVIRLDMLKNIRTREPMTYITPHVDIRQEPGWNHLVDGKWVRHTNGPLYMDPYPLSAEFFLVAHNPDKPWKDVRAYGLYLIDEFGNHVLIHKDPEFSCWQPYPLRPREAPPVLPDTRDAELAARDLAVCMVQDVYHGMEGVERGSVKYIRIMEQVPRPWAARRFWDQRGRYGSHTALVSRGSVLAVKVLHGVVPVHEDGSAHFHVPADRNIYFQALDENYMEIQRERTYVNYRPGEKRTCVGCHETPHDSLPRRYGITLARKAPALMPGPQPGDRTAGRAIHYITDVQPVLDRHCVRCHGASSPKGGLDLTGTLTTRFCRSYENILRRGLVKTFDEGSDWGGTPYAPPKTVGSYASRFIRQVRKGCTGNAGKLPLADFVKLATWVDSNAQYYGSYWGRKNIRYKDHPDFRPVPTFAQAVSTEAPTAGGSR